MATAAVIVAAGRGTRAGAGLPKQWRELGGRTLVARCLETFRASPIVGRICLVLHPDDMGLAPGYAAHGDVVVAAGGATRAASVRAGLEALAGVAPDRVLIHDVARPLVSQALIASVDAALDGASGAAPALPITDAVWRVARGRVAGVEDREALGRAQTPQGFRFGPILAAHRAHGGGAGDDVEVALAAGLDVVTVPGDERNIKITGPEDFARAELLLEVALDIRSGTGFDVHRFGPGEHVTLCGVRIPHDRGLLGHSDADVGLHAITDAIYGALADGDIGRHFPPTDPQWAGADSRIFLEHAAARAVNRGFRIGNIDCTLICEVPKIAPHAAAMARAIAQCTGVEDGRVSVKATTSEGLGFTGRGEGIAALGQRNARRRMSRSVATLFGIGNLGPGPGTWGSAVAVALAWPIHALGGFPALAGATLLAFVIGWWSVAEVTRGSTDHDPAEIVIDELVGQWIALWPLSAGLWLAGVKGWTFPWPGWVAAFVLFRLFDIWKPGPVGWMDRRADAAGTMLDDVVAGAMAAVCVAVLGWLAHGVFAG